VILIVDGQIEQHVFLQQDFGERGKKPCGQGVRVHGGGDVQQGFVGAREIAGEIVFEQGGAPQILQQTLAHLRRTARPRAHDQWVAQPCFERPHTLRYRRRREIQPHSGLLEAAGFDDRADGGGLSRVEVHGSTLKGITFLA
jgi:hypothetical protein